MEVSNDISALKALVTALLSRVEALESENAALRAENTELRRENAELRSRLNLNSKNSHKPPSSDGLTKKPGLPKGPAKKSGGQFGHKGRTLKMVETPDNIIRHHVVRVVERFFPLRMWLKCSKSVRCSTYPNPGWK